MSKWTVDFPLATTLAVESRAPQPQSKPPTAKVEQQFGMTNFGNIDPNLRACFTYS